MLSYLWFYCGYSQQRERRKDESRTLGPGAAAERPLKSCREYPRQKPYEVRKVTDIENSVKSQRQKLEG